MIDFTLSQYRQFLKVLKEKKYQFQTFGEYLDSPAERVVMLRHDVDARKLNSLQFAEIQHEFGIRGSYYFRVVPQSYDETVIRKIAGLGHEIGYHYETMDSSKGNIDKAFEEFCRHLELFRKIVPVKTICMHGSPRSPYDNKEIWKKYNYKSLGLTGEPYYDLDFNKVAYLTDTGRCWNGASVSVRDKVSSDFHFNFSHTSDIIANIHQLPDKVMFTFHPQRWTNHPLNWLQELLMQNMKNQVKKILLSGKKSGN
jgi:hypothetical protein